MLYIKKILIVILLSMIALGVSAQEFRCSVSINSQQIQTTEKQIFETMKQTIEDFVNNRKWTTLTFEAHEKMDCNIGLILSERASLTEFKGQLSIQIRRPVYNSNYTTGLFNYIESDFQFSFNESQPLEFDINSFTSNLSSAISYYLYMFLGITFDSYALMGGENFYEVARTIAQTAEKSGYRGWRGTDGQKARYWFMENYTNATYQELRKANYYYHRLGLDMMTKDQDEARRNIMEALRSIQKVHKIRTNLLAVQIFMDVKIPEISNIFTPATDAEKKEIYNIVKEISPINLNKIKGFDGR
ncbi:MAG: DUF4835 family protein [Bacteroidales bacterium]|nr:DUF4835 family protein [Bacteroidales bacterium]MBR5832781.1 DUF4835 family protein [Bacteroidales bacterium]